MGLFCNKQIESCHSTVYPLAVLTSSISGNTHKQRRLYTCLLQALFITENIGCDTGANGELAECYSQMGQKGICHSGSAMPPLQKEEEESKGAFFIKRGWL